MNDCVNAEFRDRLPDLLHERLDGAARAAVVAHVDGCVDCRDELQLLRDMRSMVSKATPRVDVAYVVGALPRAPQRQPVRLAPSRRPLWSDWRVAAAVTLLVAGGGSYAVMNSSSSAARTPAVAAATPVATTASAAPTVDSNATAPEGTVAVATDEAAGDRAVVDVGTDSRLSDLTEAQLQKLLDDVQNLRAVPATEPEPVTIKVNANISSEGV